MGITSVIGDWVWTRWLSKKLGDLLKVGLAALLTWLASKGATPEQLASIAQAVNPDAVVAIAGAVFYFLIDLVVSIRKHR